MRHEERNILTKLWFSCGDNPNKISVLNLIFCVSTYVSLFISLTSSFISETVGFETTLFCFSALILYDENRELYCVLWLIKNNLHLFFPMSKAMSLVSTNHFSFKTPENLKIIFIFLKEACLNCF